MAKKNENRIPETFWKTPVGQTLCNKLHHDGWEALDVLNSVNNAIDEAVKGETNEAIKTELEKAQKQFKASIRAFRRGFYGFDKMF